MKKLCTWMVVVLSAVVANAGLTYTTGLDVWLDASDIDGSGNATLTDGQAITTWVNKGTTGVGNAAKNGSTSTYAASNEVHNAAVTLNNSLYQTGEFSDSTNRTIYFVVNRAASSGAEGTLLNDYGGAGGELLMVRTGSSGSGQRDASNDATWLTESSVDVDDQWLTLFYSFNAADGTIRFGEVGGTIQTETVPVGYDLNTTFEGGQDPVLFGFHDGNNSHDFNGLVSEVLIYDHLLDASTQALVESYLATKASQDPELNPISDAIHQDAYMEGGTNYDTAYLKVDAGNQVSHLRFSVTNATRRVLSARLVLQVDGDPGSGTIRCHAGNHTYWNEATINSVTAPTKGPELDALTGLFSVGSTSIWDVTHFVTGDGDYSFLLDMDAGGDEVWFSSKEGVAPPRLELAFEAPALPDADGDGMRDVWEQGYFGSTSATHGAEDADFDLDGMNNLQEFLAGTDPTNPESLLAIKGLDLTTNEVSVAWSAVPGKSYNIWGTSNLLSNDWSRLVDEIPALPPTTSFVLAPTSSPSFFLRVELDHATSSQPGEALELYVDPAGDDSNPGTSSSPVRTLEAVRDWVRQRPAYAGAVITLKPGRYPRNAPFELDERDSGTEDAPIVYQAETPGTVWFDGGKVIPATACLPVVDQAILSRMVPEATNAVRVVDLAALGITDYGTVGPRGFGRAVHPGPLEMYFNRVPMQIARWPNAGEESIPLGTVRDAGSVPRSSDFSLRGALFDYDVVRAERWTQASDWYVSGFFKYGFAEDTLPVANLNTAAGTIETTLPHLYGMAQSSFTEWYALNLLEEIDLPGEYFVDTSAGLLYFFPPDPLEGAEIQVSVLSEPLVALEGASHVHFKDLGFENARGTGIYIEGGTANRIDGCTLRNLGMLGVQIGQGSTLLPYGEHNAETYTGFWEPVSRKYGSWAVYIYDYTEWNRNGGDHHAIVNCDIYDVGSGGVLLGGGDRVTLTPAHNRVENCDIYRVNRWEKAYKAPVNIDGVGNIIRNCHLHDCPGQAILLHGNDHIIEYNELDHVVQDLSDQAAIYSGRDPSECGTMIRHNFFHDIENNHPGSYGVQAIFFDDYGTYTAYVFGNVFYNAGSSGVIKFLRGGESPIVNNIFIDGPQVLEANAVSQSGLRDFMLGGSFSGLGYKRIREAVDILAPPYLEKYPVVGAIYNNTHTVGHPMERNYTVNGDMSEFVDPDNLNFQLKEDSSVYSNIYGFEPIPFEQIGLQR